MNTKRFSEAMSEIDDKYVDETINYQQKKKKINWIKWTSIAACFALVAVFSIGVWQGGWFSSSNDIATLDNGDKIIFSKSDIVGSSLSLAFDMTTRELTEEETRALFADLPVAANAIFIAGDEGTGNAQELIGFEGKIGEIKLIITTSDLPLLDTTIIGNEKATEVDGVSVTAGYFLTDPNSRDEQTVIYYAAFELGSNIVYVENAGTKAESETVKNDLAAVIQKLIGNGELDLTSVKTNQSTE